MFLVAELDRHDYSGLFERGYHPVDPESLAILARNSQ